MLPFMRSEPDGNFVGQRRWSETRDQRPEIRGQRNRQSERPSRQRPFDRPALQTGGGRAEYRNDESTAALLNFRPIRLRPAPVTGFTRRPGATPAYSSRRTISNV